MDLVEHEGARIVTASEFLQLLKTRRQAADGRGHKDGSTFEKVWRDQDPPAADVLLDINMPFSGGSTPAYLEVDKLPDGRYRATVGTLFEFQELCRTGDLEGLLRQIRAVQSSGSFDEMVRAIRAMQALDESGH